MQMNLTGHFKKNNKEFKNTNKKIIKFLVRTKTFDEDKNYDESRITMRTKL